MASSSSARSSVVGNSDGLASTSVLLVPASARRSIAAAAVSGAPAAGAETANADNDNDDSDNDNDGSAVEMAQLQGGGDSDPGVTQVPGSTRNKPIGLMVAHHALAVPRPTSVWSSTILQADPRKTADRISNQLEIHGTMADATTQIDPRAIISELPSERRLKKEAGYSVRMGMESSMPYTAGLRSVTQERHEMQRLQRNPTIREARTMKDQGNAITSFRAALTKAAREKEKVEKATLTGFQRFKWSISAFFKRTRERINRMENPLWKGRIKELESHFGGTYVSYFLFVRWLFILNCIISTICIYLVVAMGIADQNWENIQVDFIPYIPSWRGNVTSFFFMGGYQQYMLSGTYRMDFGYFCCIIGVFVVSFIAVVEAIRQRFVAQMAHSYSYGKKAEAPYSTAVFTSYDFTRQKQRAIKAQQRALTLHLKELKTRDEVMAKRLASRQGLAYFIIILKRILANIIVFGLMAVMAYTVYYTIRNSAISTITVEGIVIRVTPLVISAFNIVLPTIFGYLSIWEDYLTEVTTSRVDLARSYILKMAAIYVLLFGYIGVDKSDILGVGVCWETAVGQEFYTLMWTTGISGLALLVYLLTTLATAFGMELFFYLRKKKRQNYNFDISSHVIQLIYLQAILWLGFSFSPIMPIIGTLFYVAIFYTTSFVLFSTGKQPKRIFSASSLNTFFLVIALLTLAGTGAPIAWSMSMMTPACGPHASYPFPYMVVTAIIDSAPEGLAAFLYFFTTTGFVASFILCLIVLTYWLYAVSAQRHKRINELEEEMLAEREDKRYLMQFYNVQ